MRHGSLESHADEAPDFVETLAALRWANLRAGVSRWHEYGYHDDPTGRI
jgi:hypothetical protein